MISYRSCDKYCKSTSAYNYILILNHFVSITVSTLLWLRMISLIWSRVIWVDQTDFCHSELFTAECSADDEILVVRNASYGRMRGTSRCLQSDPTSYIGCRTNVIKQADRMCSGRRSCRISIPNPSFEMVQPCPKTTRSYLEIVVECQKGIQSFRAFFLWW